MTSHSVIASDLPLPASSSVPSPPPSVTAQSSTLPQHLRGRPVNIAEYEQYAKHVLARQIYDYYRSGANDEVTLRENCDAFQRLIIRPRFLVDVSNLDLSTTILGQRISSPICIAPTAMQRMAHDDGEIATARAAASVGTCMCLSSLSTTNLVTLSKSVPEGVRWFQLYVYRDREVTRDLVRRAEESGYAAIAVTVDTPFLGRREADVRNGFSLPNHLTLANFIDPEKSTQRITETGKGLAEYAASLFDQSLTWNDLAWLKSITRLPIVLKGILTAEDARLAVSHGASAILVSNHGARQVDTVSSTIEALPEIVQAVEGKVEVYLDGGVRRGTDVFKALALGARAVFIGRPVLWGLAYAGEEGVRDVWNLINHEFKMCMGLSGTPNVAAITQRHVTTREVMRPKL